MLIKSRRVYALALTACAAGVLGIALSRIGVNMDCADDSNKSLAEMMKYGDSFASTLQVLNKFGAQYMIFSGDQSVSIELVRQKGFKAMSPTSIVVQPRRSQQSHRKLVRKDELLTLSFNADGALIEKSCKQIYTGP